MAGGGARHGSGAGAGAAPPPGGCRGRQGAPAAPGAGRGGGAGCPARCPPWTPAPPPAAPSSASPPAGNSVKHPPWLLCNPSPPNRRKRTIICLPRPLTTDLYEPDLVVDGVQLLLQHAGQGLGVRLAAGGEQLRQHGLAVVRGVRLHARAVVAPAGVGVEVVAGGGLGEVAPQTGGGAARQAAQPAAGLVPDPATLCEVTSETDL